MKPAILNRNFEHPADGWYMIEPAGEHPARGRALVQVIDRPAIDSIVNRFNADADAGQLSHGHEMLIDHEHFKHDLDKETTAYGWLNRLQARDDGIYGRIRWTDTGQQAVDGGDYRFFSTEYDPGDLKVLNDGKVRRVRPLRLDGLTLTNDPNNKGGKPITNRKADCEHMNKDGTFKGGFDGCVLHMQSCEGHSEESAKKICGKIAQQVANRSITIPLRKRPADDRCPDCLVSLAPDEDDAPGVSVCPHCGDHFSPFAGSGETAEVNNRTKTHMKQIANALGLADEASEDSVLAAVTKLQNRVSSLEPLDAENKKLKNRLAELDTASIDALLASRGVKDDKVLNRLRPVLAGQATLEERNAFLDDCGFVARDTRSAAAQTQVKLFNRDAKPPGSVASDNPAAEKAAADKIMNRARSLVKDTPHLSLATAVRMAQVELGTES